MSTEKKVRKSNIFIDGRYRFTANEQKVLLLVISKIEMFDYDFEPYKVPWNEIKNATNGKVNTVKKIDVVCESLKNRTIKIRKGHIENNFGFLSGWEVSPGNHVLFRVDPGMAGLLLDLLKDGNFTLYNLECVLSLNSAYSIRMYEILKSNLWKKQPLHISLDSLKWSLDIDLKNKSYTDFGNFRQFVLERAKKDLKKHTDIQFTYEKIKDGRRIGGLLFTITKNKSFQRTIQSKCTSEEIKKTVTVGDIVMINGVECEVLIGGCYYKKGMLPTGQLNTLLNEGKIQIKDIENEK